MKRRIIILLMPLLMLLPALAFMEPAYAACGQSTASQQAFQGISETTGSTSCDDRGVNSVLSVIVNILSMLVGAAAVIVIIISGFKYITSGGDSSKVGNAKNTLIYALVGVAIAALAQVLVHFVLHTSNNAVNLAPPSGQQQQH
ncbi:MAG TPA: pilin [Candidatus Saccharimonadales bacterium]